MRKAQPPARPKTPRNPPENRDPTGNLVTPAHQTLNRWRHHARARQPILLSWGRAFPRPLARRSPSRAASQGRHATCAKARHSPQTSSKLFQTVPTRPPAHAPAQNEPRSCNRVQPDATNSKTAKRSQVPFWHTPTPPPSKCAKFPNEPTAPVTPSAANSPAGAKRTHNRLPTLRFAATPYPACPSRPPP